MTDSGEASDGLSPPVQSPPERRSSSPDGVLWMPKNRSTGNLLMTQPSATDDKRNRFSFDASTLSESLANSSLLSSEDLGTSGLRRIRQQQSSRVVTLPTSVESSFVSSTPHLSQSISGLNSARRSGLTLASNGPASPALNVGGEDLHRFPYESLHSFSFAHQSEDFLHSRQNVLKRSIDFMRDRLAWAASHPGIISAQARISGDAELQGMMELLSRANLLGQDNSRFQHMAPGPLTGPAHVDAENVFEKSFAHNTDSPEMVEVEDEEDETAESKYAPVFSPAPTQTEFPESDDWDEPRTSEFRSSRDFSATSRRASLKRTYTDLSALSLQGKLVEALAQPYLAGDPNTLLTPSLIPGLGLSTPKTPGIPGATAVHSHASRWAPAAQAVFRTEGRFPWTISAANDLACLVFGVTQSEVRKIGILEVVQEERREWLKEKLHGPSMPEEKVKPVPNTSSRIAPRSSFGGLGNGVTAQLLSKPSSREQAGRRAQTDDGSGSTLAKGKTSKGSAGHMSSKSRGVLLCGDVVPIQKRNGATGSASFWVMEKKGGLIWVLEEIEENIAHLQLDENLCISQATGDVEHIFGKDRANEGVSITKLLPRIPRQCISGDLSKISEHKQYTARYGGSINIPVTVTQTPEPSGFRISSFPHIAGIMVLNATTLNILSSNTVFSAALFGQDQADGLSITNLIPNFDAFLRVLTEEDNVKLVDGIVIPEHSFRRARALYSLREGKANAAAIFLRPTGLPAKHRDGSEIAVDVQMRVVKSETFFPSHGEGVIQEQDEDDSEGVQVTEVVYALWITYSRQLHASNMIPSSLLMSRPGTPPHQPSPGQASDISPQPLASPSQTSESSSNSISSLTQKIQEATSQPISGPEPIEHPAMSSKIMPPPPKVKKTIDDFVILEEMGQGAYGQVKLARYKRNGLKKVVLKYVTKKRILVDTWTRDRRLGTVPLEIHVLDYLRRDGLRHPNIVEMIDFFEDNVNYYIEMVPHGVPGMDLFDYIELRTNMEEGECRNIFKQVVDAIHHLHTKALVVHRDIKDENVILDGEGKIKLIDFGSAAYIKNGPFDVFVGTIDYAAPEVLQGKSYRGKEQDVWALGILLYTIVYKENPFYNIDEILDHPLRIPFVPFSEDCIDLIQRTLDRDVDERLTITQVMEHPWMMKDS